MPLLGPEARAETADVGDPAMWASVQKVVVPGSLYGKCGYRVICERSWPCNARMQKAKGGRAVSAWNKCDAAVQRRVVSGAGQQK